MARSNRQVKLLEIIKTHEVERQSDLVELLKEAGFDATQATISRDIKELGLIKTAMHNKKYRYIMVESKEGDVPSKLFELFKEAVKKVSVSLNIVVLNTIPGTANSAAALLDSLSINGILGTVAGDDTVIIVAESIEKAPHVAERMRSML